MASALFCLEETTHDYIMLLEDLVKCWGVPLSLYTDKTHCVHTQDRHQADVVRCQFTRAMDELRTS